MGRTYVGAVAISAPLATWIGYHYEQPITVPEQVAQGGFRFLCTLMALLCALRRKFQIHKIVDDAQLWLLTGIRDEPRARCVARLPMERRAAGTHFVADDRLRSCRTRPHPVDARPVGHAAPGLLIPLRRRRDRSFSIDNATSH